MKTIMQQLQNLGGLAGIGSGATTKTGSSARCNAASDIAGFNVDQGKALASKDLAIGGINAQMWNNAGSFLDQAVSAFYSGPGGAPFSLGKFLGASDAGTGRLWRASSQRSGCSRLRSRRGAQAARSPLRSGRSAA
jgi:hypothetical protein